MGASDFGVRGWCQQVHPCRTCPRISTGKPKNEAYRTTSSYLDQLAVASREGEMAQHQERRARCRRKAKHPRPGEVAIGGSYSLLARFLARKLA